MQVGTRTVFKLFQFNFDYFLNLFLFNSNSILILI